MLVGAAAVFADFSAPIWWHQPWPYPLVSAAYTELAWLAGGLVLAAFVKPAAPTA